MKRRSVNKNKSARSFAKGVNRTKSVNLAPPPNRGGYRF